MRLTRSLLRVFAAVLADAGSVTAMHKLVAWMLVPGVLSLSAIAVVRAQDRGAKPNAAARAANAPPLVPVRLNMEGNFRIAPPYAVDPAFTRKPEVPPGRLIRFTMNPAESKLFPTAPAGRGAGGPARGRGETTPTVPAEPTTRKG